MKLRLLVLVALAAVVVHGTENEKFYDRLTPEERRAAGIDQLTPEQQAALSVLAERWAQAKSEPAVTAARQQAIAEVKAVAKEEARAAAKAELEAEKKARVGLADKKSEPDLIHAKLLGTFRAWGPGAVFPLENGQIWMAEKNTEERFFGRRDDVEVEIRPSAFGTWKLTLLPDGLWIRVKRIK